MPDSLKGKKVAILATDGVEQVEFTKPRDALLAAGATVDTLSIKSGSIQGFNHLDKGDTFPVDLEVSDARADDYDALVLPGGVANPDALRMDAHAVSFVRSFFDQRKPVAAICHAPWLLIEAEAVRGRTITSWPSLRTDLPGGAARLSADLVAYAEDWLARLEGELEDEEAGRTEIRATTGRH